MNNDLPDFQKMYEKFQSLSPGQKAELRRVKEPQSLIEIPSFYRLMTDFGTGKQFQRLAFCLPFLKHADNGLSIGKSLAYGKVSEKRLFQVVRSEFPNDMVQFRRLLQHVEPVVNWLAAGKQLFYWGEYCKRQLLEDYFLNLSKEQQ